MSRRMVLSCSLSLLTAFLVAVGGCRRQTPQVAPAEPPSIPVSLPIKDVVTDYVDFTGRTNAVNSVASTVSSTRGQGA